jgi:flagellar biosynthesis GTPase FlhF
MPNLKVADNLSLALDVVTSRCAFVGGTGSGKTYAAMKLAEEMIQANAQIVAMDPVGVWYGLRIAADGSGGGLKIPVFGGLHGDIPLEHGSGAYIADLIVDQALSVVLDVSQFEHDTQKAKFASDFATRFFFRKKAAPSAVHIFLEECQEFVPQNVAKGEEHMLHAFVRMWKIGRNFGIGGSLISQRPQEINKKAINLTQYMFAFRMNGPHERDAMQKWIGEKGLDVDLAAILPKLQTGQPHIWIPEHGISGTYKIAAKKTLNVSSTPEVGKTAARRHLAPIDLERISKEMAATIERAKADDPKELRKKISTLEREMAKKPVPVAAAKVEEKIVNVPVVEEHVVAKVEELTRAFEKYNSDLAATREEIRESSSQLADAFKRMHTIYSSGIGREVSHKNRIPVAQKEITLRRTSSLEMRPKMVPRTVNGNPGLALPEGEKKILIACAQYPDGMDKTQLSILTGYKRSTRDRYIQYLRAKEFVTEDRSLVFATQAGVDALGNDFEPLPTGVELQEYWLDRLPDGERKILKLLVDCDGKALRRDELDEPTGFKRSTRDRYLQYLAARKLVEAAGNGEVKAAEFLFG